MAGGASVLISRHLGSDAARASLEDDLARRLNESGHTVLITPHLYHLPHGSDAWSEIAAFDGDLAVAGWISPRSLECLVREYAHREPVAAFDLSATESADEAFTAISDALGSAPVVRTPSSAHERIRELDLPVTERWYPVLDRSRCTSCRHCLQFCLFGVYDVVDRQVVAVLPDNCKNGCPACARVCPQGAVIFPLSDEPAIAGMPGTIMRPDAAARRMYYVRTGRRCPVCGEVAQAGSPPEGVATCEECGGPLGQPAATTPEPSPVHEEIDALIDALDDLAAGGGGE